MRKVNPWTKLACVDCNNVVYAARSTEVELDPDEFRCEPCEMYRCGYEACKAEYEAELSEHWEVMVHVNSGSRIGEKWVRDWVNASLGSREMGVSCLVISVEKAG